MFLKLVCYVFIIYIYFSNMSFEAAACENADCVLRIHDIHG